MQLLAMYRYKCTSIADIESRGLYDFFETLVVFENPEERDRMRNKRYIEILTNAFFQHSIMQRG